MSAEPNVPSVDMIRWTFTVDPAKRGLIESHLNDLGVDVFVHGESQFHVSWDEPDRVMDDEISELWDLNGEPFEITQEEFHRVSLMLVEHDPEADSQAAA